ncbi:MAG: 30S ribosome-binding factor RbfA [Actinomycetota bacterium]|nr:30S ribosome-binding factor RbfA [Actinomycetota bacterium]
MSPANYPRAERVRKAIKEVLASEVERLKDPGLGFVTITEVTLSPDLRQATAYYTVLGEEVERASSKDALARASKHLRSTVAKEIRLRYVPQIEFKQDPVPEQSARIDQLLAELHRKEEP